MNDADRERHTRWLLDDVSGDERAQLERAALSDPVLAETLYADVALDAALRETAARSSRSPRATRRTRHRARAIGALAVAAAVVLLVARPSWIERSPSDEPTLRSADSSPVTLLEPRGERADFPRRFAWTSFEDARAYRWELYDTAARRVAVEVVRDTVLVRSTRAVPIDSVATWRWLVVVVLASGAEGPTSRSETFTVVPPVEDR